MDFNIRHILFLDFESYYSSKDGLGFKDQSCTEYVRDPRFKAHGLAYRWQHEDRTHWVSGDHTLQAWIGSVDWANTVVVAHNVRFDGAILAWLYKVRPFAWFDTVALAKAVLGENVSGYHLKGLAEYLGLQAKGELKWDGVRNLTPEQETEMAEYCKGDTDICKGIYERLIGQFPESQLFAMDWTIRAFVEPQMVLDTICLSKGVENEKARREEVIKKSGVEKDVLSSNKQFAELLQQRGLAVPTKISSRTGKSIPAFARTDDGMSELVHIAPDLYNARIASKANLLETRGESLLAVAKTGPFPFDVGFSGAVQTHRYSGGSGAGGNPQNFTRKSFLREAVRAPQGHSLIVGDFAAVELRILAWLAKEPRLINPILNNVRIYSEFATLFYKRPINKADNPEEDAFGKSSVLGLGYQMGKKRFIDKVKADTGKIIDESTSWATVRLYRDTYFNVPKLWEACQTLIPLIAEGRIGCLYFAPFIKVRKGALILPSGLAIKYPNLRFGEYYDKRQKTMSEGWHYDVFIKKYEKEAVGLYGGKVVENICQGLAGELTKEAIERAEKAGLSCVGQVHDEILAVCRQDSAKGQAEKAAVEVLRNAMEQSPRWMPELRLSAEVGYGGNWNESKK